MSEVRSKYSREFKLEAVGLLESKSGKEVEEALGIASGMVTGGEGSWNPKACGRSRATAIPVMRSWAGCARKCGSCARSGTSCEKERLFSRERAD